MKPIRGNFYSTTLLVIFFLISLSFTPVIICHVYAEDTKDDSVMYDEGKLRDPCTDYDWVGNIDQVGRDGNYMIIDDCVYKFHPKITFHSYSSRNISRFNLKPGKKVGFIVNEKRELMSVCIMKN